MSAIHNSSLYENRASCTVFNPSFPYGKHRMSERIKDLSGGVKAGRMPVQEKGTSSFLRKQKYSMLKNVHGCTFFSEYLPFPK